MSSPHWTVSSIEKRCLSLVLTVVVPLVPSSVPSIAGRQYPLEAIGHWPLMVLVGI